MSTPARMLTFVALATASFIAGSRFNERHSRAGRRILYYHDPMHPAYKSDKPGTAPDCGMDLVPKYADDQPMNMAPGSVMIAADKRQLIGVRTAEVQRESLVRDVRTTGQVVADESKIAHIHVKVNG